MRGAAATGGSDSPAQVGVEAAAGPLTLAVASLSPGQSLTVNAKQTRLPLFDPTAAPLHVLPLAP